MLSINELLLFAFAAFAMVISPGPTNWLFELQNTFNRSNVAYQYFDTQSNTLKYAYQLGILPNMSYRLEF